MKSNKVRVTREQMATYLGKPLVTIEEVATNVYVATLFVGAPYGPEMIVRGSGADTTMATLHMWQAAAHELCPTYEVTL